LDEKKHKTHITYSVTFCRKSCHLWAILGNYCTAGQATTTLWHGARALLSGW